MPGGILIEHAGTGNPPPSNAVVFNREADGVSGI